MEGSAVTKFNWDLMASGSEWKGPEDMRCAGAAVCMPVEEGLDLLSTREVISASWGFTVTTGLISLPATPVMKVPGRSP